MKIAGYRRMRRKKAEIRHTGQTVPLVGPIPAPDYTMRTGWSHAPLPDRNTRGVVVDCMVTS